jgi:hypothetical protein
METLQPPDRACARIIEAYGALLDAPASRLKFVRRALARCQEEEVRQVSRWPYFQQFHRYRIIVEELVPLLPSGTPLPVSVRLALWAYKARVAVYAVALTLGAAAVAGIAYSGVQAVGALRLGTPDAVASDTTSGAAPSLTTAVPDLPGYAPGQIWLVESGEGYELFSNGARVLTEYQSDGPLRRFSRFPRGTTTPDSGELISGAPVGIVFHTSQSHIAPFAPEYNEKLQTSSRALLSYVRENRLYNYVIDRFGRIFRIVPDEYVSDHAGNSVWADEQYLYLDVSDAFLGVCFEASWSSETKVAPDQLNEAQIYAGRALTSMLRSRYAIADANCVTHALVSVSPVSKLVGFHMDLGTGFPFAALDLSDKYEVPTPSVGEFGFDHDLALDRALGGRPWPGLLEADRTLAAEARARAVSAGSLREELQKRYSSYRSWIRRHGTGGVGEGT